MKGFTEEMFMKLPGYNDNFYVSNYGRVYDVGNKRFLTPYKLNNGHMAVNIGINERRYMYLVDKLVVNTWFYMPFEFVGKPILSVEHKDGDLTNNRADNLYPLYDVDTETPQPKSEDEESKDGIQKEVLSRMFGTRFKDNYDKPRTSDIAKRALEKQKSLKVK